MEKLKDFSQLPGGSEAEPKPETRPAAEKKEKHLEMLDKMGVSPADPEKLSPKEFFDLAMTKCGYMSPNYHHNSRRVILMSIYQKAFIEYYNLTGPKKNVQFSKVFDEMSKRREIDFIPHDRGRDSFLCSPIVEE